MSPRYNSYQLSQIEQQTLRVTTNVVDEAQALLAQIRLRSAAMSEQNKRAAAEYVGGVRDALRERTNLGVQQANQIVLGKIREVENELTSFELVIDDAVGSFVEDAEFDIRNIRDRVSRADSGDAAQALDAALDDVQHEIAAMLADVDQMYSFYGRYIGHIVEHFMQNATDRIGVMLNAQRRYCDCTVSERINMCYNISAQNGAVSHNLEGVVRMMNIVRNTTDAVRGLQLVYERPDQQSRTLLDESRTALERTLQASQRTLDAILDDDSCFLGSTVRRYAYEDHATLKQFTVRSMKVVIESLARSLRRTLAAFQVVKPVHHRNRLVAEVQEKLETLAQAMRAKAALIADADTRAEYERRAGLADAKELLKTRFENATAVVNGLFGEYRDRLSDDLKYRLGYMAGQQLPYISTLTIQNYVPSDVCPLSVDYQKYVAATLRQAMRHSDDDVIGDLFDSAVYYGDDTETGAALASSDFAEMLAAGKDGDSPANEDDKGDENGGVSATLMNLIQTVISSINQAGYQVDEPVRIVIVNDDK